MNIGDLIDTNVNFSCNNSEDNCKHWDYRITAHSLSELLWIADVSKEEIEQLRENCKKILLITENISGEN